MKVWTSTEKGNDKIIAFAGDTIYNGSPSDEEMDLALFVLIPGASPPESLRGVPLSYIKEINLYEGRKYIEILYGKRSSLHLKVTNQQTREEIFNYFKDNIADATFTYKKIPALQSGKKPLIAFVVVAAIFAWTLYMAIHIKEEYLFDSNQEEISVIVGMVIYVASFGVTNVILIFSVLLAIAALAFIMKVRKPTVVSKLRLIRP